MVHYFKLAGQRVVLDEASGYTALVDEITYKMLAYLTLPLPEDCPSAIRYDMAKYESTLVDKTYQNILADHKAGKLYTDVPFDKDKAPSHCMLISYSPLSSLEGVSCPVIICDTYDPEHAALLCSTAKEKGLHVTVFMTKDGTFPCDRLFVDEEKYEQYKDAAPEVGVRFPYDAKAPKLLAHVTALADAGITLIDAYPMKPIRGKDGEYNALLKELNRVAKELFLRKKEGRPVEFWPFAQHGFGAKHIQNGHANARCQSCSHRMHCGGRCLSAADCEYKKTCVDASILLSLA